MEFKYDNLAVYEEYFQQYMQDSKDVKQMKIKMQGYHDLNISGSREIYKVW